MTDWHPDPLHRSESLLCYVQARRSSCLRYCRTYGLDWHPSRGQHCNIMLVSECVRQEVRCSRPSEQGLRLHRHR
jgi:hypothetical protein